MNEFMIATIVIGVVLDLVMIGAIVIIAAKALEIRRERKEMERRRLNG